MTRDELLQFMRSEKYAVQTSVSPGGAPQAAVVGIAVFADFAFFYDAVPADGSRFTGERKEERKTYGNTPNEGSHVDFSNRQK